MLDHRAGAPVPDEIIRSCGLPTGAGHKLFEAATYTCSHCQYVTVIEPKRTRERAYCRKCDHYICDRCGLILSQTGVCRTFNQVIAEALEAVRKQADTPAPILLLPD